MTTADATFNQNAQFARMRDALAAEKKALRTKEIAYSVAGGMAGLALGGALGGMVSPELIVPRAVIGGAAGYVGGQALAEYVTTETRAKLDSNTAWMQGHIQGNTHWLGLGDACKGHGLPLLAAAPACGGKKATAR